MVHHYFEWCHGGNQVFLCGDFTGWSNCHQMVNVEGSSTNFMTICDLTPGLHKFKFFVDGVWRVDERQRIVKDEHGVNNYVVVAEPRLMDIDGSCDRNLDDGVGFDDKNLADDATTSGSGVSNEPELVLTGDDVTTTHRQLFKHLSSYKAYDIMPDSGKAYALDNNISVEEAFLVMHEEGLAVAPLWDAANLQISGMLTASDFIMILIELQRNHTNNVNQLSTISAWKEGKLQLQRRPLIHENSPYHLDVTIEEAREYRDQLFLFTVIARSGIIGQSAGLGNVSRSKWVGPDDSLIDVAVRILQNNISAIPVLYVLQGSTCPQLLHVASLSGILEHIRKHFEHRMAYLPLLQHSIGALQVGTWIRQIGGARELKTFSPNYLLGDAYRLLLDEHISSVPIVDDKGALLNVFCRSDVISLAKGNAYVRVQLDQTTISQALQLVDTNARARYGICTRSDSLYRVISLLSDPGMRRIVVVDAGTQFVLGLITLRDILNLIFRNFS